MKHYKQLNQEQRYQISGQISGLSKAGLKQTKIAAELDVDKGTISRELKRNAGKVGWRPKQAQSMRDNRRQACLNGPQFSSTDWQEVERLTMLDMSPQQVSERLEFEGVLQISYESIYQRIYEDKWRGSAPAFAQPETTPQALC